MFKQINKVVVRLRNKGNFTDFVRRFENLCDCVQTLLFTEALSNDICIHTALKKLVIEMEAYFISMNDS